MFYEVSGLLNHICDMKSVAPSSGNFTGDPRGSRPVEDIGNSEIKIFTKLLGHRMIDFGTRLTQGG